MMNRRDFSKLLLATGASALAPGCNSEGVTPAVSAQQATDQTCDLLIKGGTVVDPAQKLHAVMDIAVKGRKILAVSKDFPADRASLVFSAKNKIVTPGWVDLHVHCFEDAGGVNADHYCLGRGTTTALDAGSAVVNGPLEIDNFIKHVVETSQTRVYQALSMRGVGGSVPNTPDITLDRLKRLLDPEVIAQAALNNKPVVVGIKGRLIAWNQYFDPSSAVERESIIMQMALEASKRAQVPLLLHYTNPKTPMPEILKMLRKGDVMTHTFNPLENGILDANGKILPAMREARQRGVLFDVGAYHVSYFSFDVMEKALQQDFPPDTISSDIHSSFTTMYPLDDFPIVASKFFALGMKLDDIIDRVTVRAAQAFPFASHGGTTGTGTLKPGSDADISLFELQEGTFNWVDTIPPRSQSNLKIGTRVGHQRLVNTATVCRGKLWVNQSEI